MAGTRAPVSLTRLRKLGTKMDATAVIIKRVNSGV